MTNIINISVCNFDPMKKAKIYITGQIGNSYADDGSVSVKGVELQDVVAQVEDAKKTDATIEGYDVIIKSLGGSIRVGKLIAKYVKSLPNCITIADTECASMGTEIHLAVAKENRKIIAGTKYSIHNPLMVGVTGNASELIELSETIKENEKDMAKMYVSATGLTKDAVTGLMNQETSLTPEQCVTMGFCSEILPAEKLNAVAFFEPIEKTQITMSGIKKILADAFALFKKEMKIAEVAPAAGAVKTMDHTTDKGKLTVTMAGDVCAIGDSATLDGTPAPDGDYIAEDGSKISIVSGLISAIETKEVAVTEVAKLQAENAELKATIETMSVEFKTTLEASLNELKAQIGSSFTPASSQAKFASTKKTTEKSIGELAKERKEMYKKK